MIARRESRQLRYNAAIKGRKLSVKTRYKIWDKLKVANGNKIHLSPHQILFHTTMTKRNFILVKPPAPRFAILYESSAINELRISLSDAKITAQDDWTAIQDALIGGD